MPPSFGFAQDGGELGIDELRRIQEYMTPILVAALGPAMDRLSRELHDAITEGLRSVRTDVGDSKARLDRQNDRITELEKEIAVMKAWVIASAAAVTAVGGLITFATTYFVLKPH